MATTQRLGSEKAVERFGGGGMALLPWTRHMLTALWEQVRLLVQVIYYTFMSVFQMFRFEVHVRITDESGRHSDPDPFLFSSLFSEESGPNPTAEALLSSLRADELCCDPEASIFLGHKHQSSWTVGDWNIFVSSSEPLSSDEERSSASHWSSEEEHSGVEFDSDESKALWESLSSSNDPYNPFCFSACISTSSSKAFWETQSQSEDHCSPGYRGVRAEETMGWSQTQQKMTAADITQEESKAFWESESKSTDVICDSRKEDLEESQSHALDSHVEDGEEGSKAFWETESNFSNICSPISYSTNKGLEESHRSNVLDLSLETIKVKNTDEESKAFWERESKLNHIPTNPDKDRSKSDTEMWLSQTKKNLSESGLPEDSREFWETESKCSDDSSDFSGDMSRSRDKAVTLGKFWECGSDSSESGSELDFRGFTVSRSDSSGSWSGSESSEHREDDELLWEFFTNDPYNPLCFSATERTERRPTEDKEEEREEELWRSLSQKQDPYHPLNFKALGSQRTAEQKQDSKEDCVGDLRPNRRPRGTKPRLGPRRVQPHRHPPLIHRPWKKHRPSAEEPQEPEKRTGTAQKPQKKVRFSDQVLVHVMRSWPFARQTCRRGPWEEAARDRDRFKRRIQETERVIGHCFSPENRARVKARLGLDQN